MIKGFVALKILVQFGDHDYAMLSQFFVVSMVGVQLVATNFDAPFVTYLVNHPQGHRTAVNGLVHYVLLIEIVAALLIAAVPGPISFWIWGESYLTMLGLLFVYVIVLSGNNVTLLCYQADRNFSAYSRLQIVQQLFQLCAFGLGLWSGKVAILVYLVILFELLLWGVGWRYKRLLSFSKQQILLSRDWIRTNWPVAWPLFIGFLMIWGLNNYGRFLVVHQLELAALASYAATFSIATLAGILINPVCAVFFPYMSVNSGSDASAVNSLLSGLTILLGLTTCLSLCLTTGTGVLMKLVARGDLFAGIGFVAHVCIAQAAYGVARLANLSTVVRNRTLHGSIAFATGLVISVVLGLLLGPRQGIVGIALSYGLGSLVSMLIILAEVLSFVKSQDPGFRPLKFALFAGVSFVMPYVVVAAGIESLLLAALFAGVASLVYLAGSWVILSGQAYVDDITTRLKTLGRKLV